MKKRQQRLLETISEANHMSVQELCNQFRISKRTLYYDIEEINYHIRNIGQIKNLNHIFHYIGSYHSLNEFTYNFKSDIHDGQERKNHILYKIFNHELGTIEQLMTEMNIAKNTVVATIESIRKDLSIKGLQLVYTNRYEVIGDEEMIRKQYMILMQEDNNLVNVFDQKITVFNLKHSLCLSDYALSQLSRFITFLNQRITQHSLSHYERYQEARNFPFFNEVQSLLVEKSENECCYVAAYIASLPSLNLNTSMEIVDEYVNHLIQRFECVAAVELESKDDFKKSLKRHLLSSYYRIKFHFPLSNPCLEEIKTKHASLFKIIKTILEDCSDFPVFTDICEEEEEIGFLTAYFGGYLKGSKSSEKRKNKLLIVCPNGLMISKTLEIQLYKYIPTIEIVGAIPLMDLKSFQGEYDYIVSTIEIPQIENVIVVKPLLSKRDIDLLISKCIQIRRFDQAYDLDKIMKVIKKHCLIQNEEKLIENLEKALFQVEEKENTQPMLKELLFESRIQVVDRCDSWKEAIQIASKPLLEDGSIEPIYVQSMIDSIESHGPYIVLADHFALPHASAGQGVNVLSMSLLISKEEVDLLSKPVNAFLVLATVDNTSHMRALASLSELLYEPQNLELFCQGDKNSILELINNQS